MPHQRIVGDAIASYKQTLNEAIAAAQTMTLQPIFELRFNTSMISKEWIATKLEGLRTGQAQADKRKCAIYTFTLVETVASDAIFSNVSRVKEERNASDKKKNLCTINSEFSESTTLYVGRSFTPRSRIRDHLNSSEGGTYAMHLEQWAKPLELEVELQVYDVPQYRDTVGLERAMNVLETGLWDHLKPLLGRRGDK